MTPKVTDKAWFPMLDDMPVVSLGTEIYFTVINES
jgi:hypothetical protein